MPAISRPASRRVLSGSRRRLPRAAALALAGMAGAPALAAGTLTPVAAGVAPPEIVDHHVDVVINNGFARTEVNQTFFNPNDAAIEAVYAFPIPDRAALAEMSIIAGELEMHGEVLSKDEADRIYGAERDQGNEAGKAEKNGYQTFEFHVSTVPPRGQTRMRFVYYQPLEIDSGVGRYVYPLEDGGTDAAAEQFWNRTEQVQGVFSVNLELRSAWPLAQLRVPGYEAAAVVDELDAGRYRVRLERPGGALDQDFVCYYRLADDLPGRVELLAYRPDAAAPGTFMLVVTPGVDLQPLTGGADYVFVLDISGSMKGKLAALVDGVQRAIGKLRAEDRFRIVTFNARARRLGPSWSAATPENLAQRLRELGALSADGSTNLHAGVSLALQELDADRATSVVLVTDAVTNTGIVDPRGFLELMRSHDVRVFGFLLGNNANWPLMKLICDTSGGTWKQVSNADDIVGQVMLAADKVTHTCLHDAELTIDGVEVFDTSARWLGKVYRGEQIVLFGRYAAGGTARVVLHAALTGADRTYETTFAFPDEDSDHPELERLWALDRIDDITAERQLGTLDEGEAARAIEALGLDHQLVTDETSMVVLPDEVFAAYGIQRLNREIAAIERAAQERRTLQAPRNHRVDHAQPMFSEPAARPTGNGGGAVTPGWLLLMTPLLVLRRGGRDRETATN